MDWVKMLEILNNLHFDWKDRRLLLDLYMKVEAVIWIVDGKSESGIEAFSKTTFYSTFLKFFRRDKNYPQDSFLRDITAYSLMLYVFASTKIIYWHFWNFAFCKKKSFKKHVMEQGSTAQILYKKGYTAHNSYNIFRSPTSSKRLVPDKGILPKVSISKIKIDKKIFRSKKIGKKFFPVKFFFWPSSTSFLTDPTLATL